MTLLQEIETAAQRIAPYTLKTPLLYSYYLSQLSGGKVYLKMESEQHTGSFKARGSMNKLLYLKEQQSSKAVITASTGNHGMGVARALSLLGMQGKVVIPENTVSTKVAALKAYGASIEPHGADCLISELYAKQTAEEKDLIYVSPYNDAQVIGGQGTIGKEIIEQCPDVIDNVLVTIGGGGLISGIATYIKSQLPNAKVIGCQPKNSPEMTLSVQSNSYQTVPQLDTLSDASAGAFEEDAITYDLCKNLVDEFYLATETEIADALKLIFHKERKLVEGAAAVAVSAFIKNVERFQNQTTIIVICGGNISEEKLKKVFL